MAFFQQFSSLAQILAGGLVANQGANQQAGNIIAAGEVQAQGALLTAQGFRVSKQSVQDVTNFNLQVQKINQFRQLSAITQQYQRTIGANITAAATSGISLNSKSALMVQAETANTFEKALLNFKLDAENKRRATIFESEIRRTSLENQARAAEYQAEASRVLAANRASDVKTAGRQQLFQSIASVGQKLPSLFG